MSKLTPSKPATILQQIVADKQIWLQQQQQNQPLKQFIEQVTPSDRNFYAALKQSTPAFILECKKASPSKGLIRPEFDLQAIASSYQPYADVISVLTDQPYFQGEMAFIRTVRQQVSQPILCKDFIIDAYQIYLARYYQADAILLMLSILDDQQYRHLSQLAQQLKMGVLTEVSNQAELQRALALNAPVIGINNRDLHTLQVDLNTLKKLAPQIPPHITVISESGINHHAQILELSQYADGFLIGSTLMAQSDLSQAVRSLIYGEHKVCGLTRPQDAKTAYQAGAIYGGLIFVAESPRYATVKQAQSVIAAAPLRWVGVFRNHPTEYVAKVAEELGLFAVQLHGQEDTDYITQLRALLPESCQIWQAKSVTNQLPSLRHPLVNRDIYDHAQGGSGQTFNWHLLQNQSLQQVMIAGGINADNVRQVMRYASCGLDINSGAETQPGQKDATRLQQIFQQLRGQKRNHLQH